MLNLDVAGAMGYSSQLGSQPVLQSTDLNSPEVFKQNIQLAQGHIARVQSLARNGGTCRNVSNASRRSARMLKADERLRSQNAYHPGTNPMQTTGACCDACGVDVASSCSEVTPY